MKARITDDGKCLQIIPETRKNLMKLRNIWNKCKLEKSGFRIHAGGTTQHGIDNSDFEIKIIPT